MSIASYMLVYEQIQGTEKPMAFKLKSRKKTDADVAVDPSEPDVSTAAAQPSAAPAQRKRKPSAMLSSVIRESVPAAAIDALKQNTAFALPNGNGWVGLILATKDINGLSQKQKNDPAKGSIIELITADKIKVVATQAMLDAEVFGIIPDAETLERMEEYSLLTQAPYHWALFRPTEEGGVKADVIKDKRATYAVATQVLDGTTALGSVLPEVWSWGGGEVVTAVSGLDAEGLVEEESIDEPLASEPVSDDDPFDSAPSDDDGGFDFNAEAVVDTDDDFEDADVDDYVDEDLGEEPEDEEDAFDATDVESDDLDDDFFEYHEDDLGDEEDVDAPTGDAYSEYVEENRDRVFDEQAVRSTIARRFLNEDLDIEIDLADFEQTFVNDAQPIELPTDFEETDWLGEQLASLSRQANTELRFLQDRHREELRTMYVETMSRHVDTTLVAVSTENADTRFARLLRGAEEDYDSARESIEQEIARERAEIRERFEHATQVQVDRAAAHARQLYEEKHRPRLERELADAGKSVDSRYESEYEHKRKTILELRQREVATRMDIGVTEVFGVLRELQHAQREAELEALTSWNERLNAVIDENRKYDIARADALAEQLARENQAERLRQEHDAQLESLRREHAEREERLNHELARIREESAAQLEARQLEWQSALEIERERVRSGEALSSQLEQQLSTLGSKYEAQYDAQYRGEVESLRKDKELFVDELKRKSIMDKRTNGAIAALVVVATIAALAVGVLAGWTWGALGGPETLTGTILPGISPTDLTTE